MSGSKNTELTVKYVCRSLADDQLRVEEDRLGRVLDEPDDGEQHERQRHDDAAGSCGSAVGPIASGAAARTSARTGRRRTPSAAAPSRSRASTPPGCRTAPRTARAAARPSPSLAARPGRPRRLPARLDRGRGGWAGKLRSGETFVLAKRRHDERERARRDDDVQRHEQVRRRSTGLDRDPERQRQHGQRRQQPRPPRVSRPRSQPTTARASTAATSREQRVAMNHAAAAASARCRPARAAGASASAPSIAGLQRGRCAASNDRREQRRRTTTPSFGQRSAESASAITATV